MLTMAGNRGPMMVETRGLKEVDLEFNKNISQRREFECFLSSGQH